MDVYVFLANINSISYTRKSFIFLSIHFSRKTRTICIVVLRSRISYDIIVNTPTANKITSASVNVGSNQYSSINSQVVQVSQNVKSSSSSTTTTVSHSSSSTLKLLSVSIQVAHDPISRGSTQTVFVKASDSFSILSNRPSGALGVLTIIMYGFDFAMYLSETSLASACSPVGKKSASSN
jgi:hypothetical protein